MSDLGMFFDWEIGLTQGEDVRGKRLTRSNHSFSSLSMTISNVSYDTLSSCCAFLSELSASNHSWSILTR